MLERRLNSMILSGRGAMRPRLITPNQSFSRTGLIEQLEYDGFAHTHSGQR